MLRGGTKTFNGDFALELPIVSTLDHAPTATSNDTLGDIPRGASGASYRNHRLSIVSAMPWHSHRRFRIGGRAKRYRWNSVCRFGNIIMHARALQVTPANPSLRLRGGQIAYACEAGKLLTPARRANCLRLRGGQIAYACEAGKLLTPARRNAVVWNRAPHSRPIGTTGHLESVLQSHRDTVNPFSDTPQRWRCPR